jgi:hypothetical protein
MGVKVEILITVSFDNVGSTFIVENSSSHVRSQHIDMRYSFVRENIRKVSSK